MPRSRCAPRILACALLLLALPACAPAPAPRPVPPATGTGLGDGTWIVGSDIPLGRYRSGGARHGGPGHCTWTTRSGMAGNSRVIDFGSGAVDQPIVVAINAAVRAFTSLNCQPWTKVD